MSPEDLRYSIAQSRDLQALKLARLETGINRQLEVYYDERMRLEREGSEQMPDPPVSISP